jgi:hypothetical protein
MHGFAEPLDPEASVLVEHDLDDCRIVQSASNLRPQLAPELFADPLEAFIGHAVPPHLQATAFPDTSADRLAAMLRDVGRFSSLHTTQRRFPGFFVIIACSPDFVVKVPERRSGANLLIESQIDVLLDTGRSSHENPVASVRMYLEWND